MSKIIMQGPAGCGPVSWGGHTYPADKNGRVAVPAEAAPDLAAHGFAVLSSADDPAEPPATEGATADPEGNDEAAGDADSQKGKGKGKGKGK